MLIWKENARLNQNRNFEAAFIPRIATIVERWEILWGGSRAIELMLLVCVLDSSDCTCLFLGQVVSGNETVRPNAYFYDTKKLRRD